MPEDRVIAEYFLRAVDVFTEQTRQIARLAYAVEQQAIAAATSDTEWVMPCHACGCSLLTLQHTKCPACLTPTREDG